MIIPICQRHAYTFTCDFVCVERIPKTSVTLHLSDAADDWASETTKEKGVGRLVGKILETSSRQRFFESLSECLDAKITETKYSGLTSLVTMTPLFITMEECQYLRETFPGVVDVSLIPKGIKILYAERDNTIKNLQRMKKSQPDRFKSVTTSSEWLHKKIPDVHRSPASKRSGVPRKAKQKTLSSRLATFFGI